MSIAYMYIGSSTLKDGLSLKIKNLDIHLIQPNSILQPSYQILKSSKIIFNGLVIKYF